MRQNYQISKQFPSHEEEEALGFPVFLLQDYIHLVKNNAIYPILIRGANSKVLAFWAFQEQDKYWSSPISAPFSSPQYFDEIEFDELLQLSISYLKDINKKPVRFVINPIFGQVSQFQFARIINIEINQFMRIDVDSFVGKLPQKKRRQKLKALNRKTQYNVAKVGTDNWENVYAQNLNWRKQKGHENYISLEMMTQFKFSFPNRYLGFQLTYKNELIGSAIVVRVSDKYLYLYSLITNPKHDKQEPSLLLYQFIYEFARANKIEVLDLGTSMDLDGKIHKNIARYKKEIGASARRKYTFEC